MLLKGSGPKSIGFQGFKIVNSKIKVVKQVEVKNPQIRPKHITYSTSPRKPTIQSTVSVAHSEKNENKVICTNTASNATKCSVDSLKEIREKIQVRRKNQAALYEESEHISLQNGTCSDSFPTSKIDKEKRLSPSKQSAALDRPKPVKFIDHVPINDNISDQIIADDSKSHQKHCDDKETRDEFRSNTYHKNKSKSGLTDDKRKTSTPIIENCDNRKSEKSYSKTRSVEDDRVRIDGHRKWHDRHNDGHRTSKRDCDERDNFDRIPTIGVEFSSSSYEKNYNHDGYHEVRDFEKDEYHSKSSHQKYSNSR